ncbi:hypothetical protein BOX15_Mlig008377g1 [Macrostomum lignano]|uniref:tRNA-splicing endonuclease subunit Sen54 N-terminal domain-containing protein n=1 Tax=Macrostomum lignano TaxID=282301 RepID=A0A267H922_9PLAT|nr:hypothetical protein BOX15_Mlig002016g1 [Macrostomum lignano]PAA94049.1 hypothetical protein BOX15_Mlig008377g1 [Macrostomum lignano]
MLVGRDLLARQPKSSSLPETGGLKRHWRDANSDSSKSEVDLAMARWRLTLTEERSASPNQLAKGEWLPNQCQVLVSGRAKFSGQFGWRRQTDGATLLHPEEALVLMELGKLLVEFGGLPLSIQQAYQTFLTSPLEFKRWLAYARLVRAGYRLVRHSPSPRGPTAAAQAPPSAVAESRQFFIDLSNRPKRRIDAGLPSSTGAAAEIDPSRAASWSEYRAASSAIVVPAIARELQSASFPMGESLPGPLLPCQDLACLTTREALQRMSLPEIPVGSESGEDCRCSVCSGQLARVDFDVFRPGHRRRRTAAGAALPDYRLAVVDVDSTPPCPVGVRALQLLAAGGSAGIGVDLLFAIVDDASVHYQVCSTGGVETIEYRF